MKKQKARSIKPQQKYDRVWNVYQRLGALAETMDRLPDAAAVRKQQPKSAPIPLTDMVF